MLYYYLVSFIVNFFSYFHVTPHSDIRYDHRVILTVLATHVAFRLE